jgi:hypothetical protein
LEIHEVPSLLIEFLDLSIAMEVIPELSDNDREQLQRELSRRCPLCDTISNPTPLKIRLK